MPKVYGNRAKPLSVLAKDGKLSPAKLGKKEIPFYVINKNW